jgi:aryl-alcohol dehydrogenase-like predicted oxidoreductase
MIDKLALGTAQFGLNYGISNTNGQTFQEETKQILNLAKEVGIKTLDTAISYGMSEKILGELGVDDFHIITKIPTLPEDLEKMDLWVDDQIKGSLSRLRVNGLYAVLLHCSKNMQSKAGEKLVNLLESYKTNGLVQNIGVSIYDPRELEIMNQVMSLDLVQAPLNLIDRRLESSGWIERLNDNGVEIHTRSSFLQGLLLLPRSRIPKKFNRWSNIWNAWHDNLIKRQTSAIKACLHYPLSLPSINKVIIGVENLTQFAKLIKTSQEELNGEDWSFMVSGDEKLINPTLWG